jgi:hypothetical protein
VLKRSSLPIAVGLGITFLPMILIAALGFPVSKWNGLRTGILILNYWPSWVLRPLFTNLDRPNADSIGDKLSCFWISALITILTYSILCFALLPWLPSRKQAQA